MPAFRTGVVAELLEERAGLQRVAVDLGDGVERAYVLTQLTGPVAPDDRVVVNTTAVDLGLGTGGWHVVHWNLARSEFHEPGPGHIMKSRYTSLQSDVGSAEEHARELDHVTDIAGMPVVACALHSQLAGIAVGIRDRAPRARIAYVMSDAAALPLALSDLVATLRERSLIDTTVTYGHTFGGDYEAVSLHSALAVARVVASADIAVVSMGPGIVGTGTRLGFTGIELGPIVDAATGLGGRPVATLRLSFADGRERHRGVSHHTLTALTIACRSRAVVAVPELPDDQARLVASQLEESGVADRHDLVTITAPAIVDAFAAFDLDVRSMGRRAAEDPALHLAAAAAGVIGAGWLP